MANSSDRTPEENIAAATGSPAGDAQPGSRLPRAADLYETLFLEHPDGVVLTVEGKISLVNDHFAEMSGYSIEEIIGMDPSDLVAPEERGRADERVQALLEKRPEYASAYTLLRKDGSSLPIDAHSKPIQHGGKAAIISVVRDVSERRQAEEALLESETLYQTLFFGSPDGVVLIVEGKIALYNDRFVEMSGYSSEEAIGMAPSELVGADERDRVDNRIRAITAGSQEPLAEYSLIRKDGSFLAIDVDSRSIQYGGKPAVLTVVRDISERKKAEEALRESEERYQRIAEYTVDVFFRMELFPAPHISYASPAIEALSGYTAEELYANTELAAGLVHPDDRSTVEQLNSSGESGAITVRWIRRDGSIIWVHGRNIPIRDEEGTLIAYEGIFSDVTERKQAEQALRESEATNSAVLMAMPDMIFRFASDGTHLGFFPGTEGEPSMPPSDFLGRNIRDTIPGLADMLMGAIGRALETKATQTLSYEFEIAGAVHAFDTRVNPCGDDEALVIVRDVTERKRGEKALRALDQERYRRLLEVAPEGIVIVDDAGVIETVNARTEELFGYDRRELIGRPLSLLIPERYRQRHLVHRQAYTSAPQARTMGAEMELYGLRKDGSEFPVDISLNALQTDAGISIIAAVRDVTERTKAEKTLRESEARFSTAFHDNPVAVAISRIRDGKIIDLNDAFLSLTGLRRAETTGRTAVEVGVLLEPAVREEIVAEVRKTGTVRDYPVQIKRKTGEMLDVLSTITQIEIDGEPCLLITNIDITERKRLEAELQSLRDDLESKVERRMEGDNPYKLTFREYTVLHLIAAGKADKEIAAELAISVYTVHRHVSHILTKMDSPSRTEAGTRALREGLLE